MRRQWERGGERGWEKQEPAILISKATMSSMCPHERNYRVLSALLGRCTYAHKHLLRMCEEFLFHFYLFHSLPNVLDW